VPAVLLLRTLKVQPTINVLIDTGCLQTNIISSLVAQLLDRDRGTRYDTSVALTSGVGGRSYGVQGIMNLTITFPYGANDTKLRVFG
jgi:hypothetical protein